eukprot:356953-Chlamydomonas_euryale.AAC.7
MPVGLTDKPPGNKCPSAAWTTDIRAWGHMPTFACQHGVGDGGARHFLGRRSYPTSSRVDSTTAEMLKAMNVPAIMTGVTVQSAAGAARPPFQRRQNN